MNSVAGARLPDEGPTEAEQGRFTESPTAIPADEARTDEEHEGEGTAEEEDGSSAEEDDDEDDDEDDEDEEDDEPVLKYSRIEGSVPEVLKKDSASALAVSGNRLLVCHSHALQSICLTAHRL